MDAEIVLDTIVACTSYIVNTYNTFVSPIMMIIILLKIPIHELI